MFELIAVKRVFAGLDDLSKVGVIAHEGCLYLIDDLFSCVILKIDRLIAIKAIAVCFFVV